MEPMQEQYPGKVPSTVQEIPGREEALQATRERVNRALSDAGEQAKHYAQYADEAVHNNPWTSVGIGFGLGIVVGALVAIAASSRNA
jgi:ElaB/YqjD/DUF883 family membrane-anchored ribosome-binding protein